ncbi:MAG: MFS transporter [Sphingomonadaceae bacterium]|nr:MFS transporter [Sphingomonadaceae bacterium]
MSEQHGGASEWKRYWYLPAVACLGYSTSSMHSYGLGAFIAPLEADFGWSRTQTSLGVTIAGLTGGVLSVPVGLLVDRFGPRRMGVLGVTLMILAFGLLGTATGTMTNWIMLWTFLAFANLLTGATIWTKAVASRFERSRGLAFAITLAGAPLTATLVPLLATTLILAYGWRAGFIGTAIAWAVVVVPMVFLFFRGAHEEHLASGTSIQLSEMPGASVPEALRTVSFYLMLFISIFFAFTIIGTAVHFVPILTDSGADPLTAAGIVSLVGIFSVIGRVGTGFLLDRIPVHLLGPVICFLPVISASLLLTDGANPVSQMVSAALLGLTVGGEIDVIAYLTSRQFGLKNYGVIFGFMVAALNIGTATGPIVAGLSYDINGNYSVFLVITMGTMAASSVALASIRKPPARSLD